MRCTGSGTSPTVGHFPVACTAASAGRGTSPIIRIGGDEMTPASRGIAKQLDRQSEPVARQYPVIARIMREASVLINDQQDEIERLRRVRNKLLNN